MKTSSAMPNILIVDDVPENLQLLSAMLKSNGYSVRPATNGKLAIDAILRSPPDLILLDIKLPDLDGFQICNKLKSQDSVKDIPIIFISALNETKDKLAAFECGGVDYVTKPFQEREVIARVQTHLALRRQQAQLQENLQQLEKLEHMRDSLTHMIVHDMRSPLMALDGHLSLLETFESKSFTQQGKNYLLHCRNSATRLKKMTSDMLAVSKLEEGKLKPDVKLQDLVALTNSVINDLQVMKSGKTIQLKSASRSLTIPLDAELIGRVIENLLGNALKFTDEDGMVQISLDAKPGEVRVAVTDDGPGIPPGDHERIFEKFGQASQPLSGRGTGLGLTFCKLAVEAHGGQIGVISQVDQGSTFWFTLKR